MPNVVHRRGSRANLVALAAANGLLPGQLYVINDETPNKVCVARTVSAFDELPATSGGVDISRVSSSDFHNQTSNPPFIGAAISAGVTNGTLAAGSLSALHPGAVLMRNAATANGGYRWQTVTQLRGGAGLKFVAIMQITVTNALATQRFGLHDSTTSADAVDGAYFEIGNTGIAVAKTANNSVRTTSGTTFQMIANTWYRLEITYLTDTSVQFRILNDASSVLYDQTIATNVPNTDARTFLAGCVCTTGSASVDAGVVDYMSVGR